MAAHKASQAGQGMALFEGIVPEALKKDALSIMVENARASEWILQRPSPNYPASNQTTGGPGAHMTAGLFGIKWFLMVCLPPFLPPSLPLSLSLSLYIYIYYIY